MIEIYGPKDGFKKSTPNISPPLSFNNSRSVRLHALFSSVFRTYNLEVLQYTASQAKKRTHRMTEEGVGNVITNLVLF
jgi:hypothetical protein